MKGEEEKRGKVSVYILTAKNWTVGNGLTPPS